MDAQGALDSFLGRLTTVLVNEAQLLGGVRGDVEFIKDEMESMNGLILYLTEAQFRDHQVKAWMRQVVGLTRDCEGNVEYYIRYVGARPGDHGLLGYLRRALRFVRTMPARHRIATRIRELKVRARDVGDRRQRYGVTVPELTTGPDMDMADGAEVDPAKQQEARWQRARLLHKAQAEPESATEVITSATDTLVKSLSSVEPAATTTQVRVFHIIGGRLADEVVHDVRHDRSVYTLFDYCNAFSSSSDYGVQKILAMILQDMIMQEIQAVQKTGQEEELMSVVDETILREIREIRGVQQTGQDTEIQLIIKIHEFIEGYTEGYTEEQLITKIQGFLKGKRFLITFAFIAWNDQWKCKPTIDALLRAADGSLPGSAIITTTPEYLEMAHSFSPCKIISANSAIDWDIKHGGKLLGQEYSLDKIFGSTLATSSIFARKMILHLLVANPGLRQTCIDAIEKCRQLNRTADHKLVRLSYNELPTKYRSCLLYLTVFPKGHVIKTTSLSRRWIAEGLLTTTSDETESPADEAKHYWDTLFARGFISPTEISPEGNIKSCTLHHEVHNVIAKIARDVNIVDMNLPTFLAHHLSIHNRIMLQKSHSVAGSEGIAASLASLAASPQWQLLKVLDLEGCHGLKKHHLESICKILLLKYLSLRNTDVTELPKQIKELQCLETLDVRQTKIRVLAKKAIVLPLLKYFLAGHKVSGANDSTTPEESVSALQMPLGIQKMENMEVLSHVQVSNSNELAGIAELLILRKLGVALHGAKLSDLFLQIEKLHRCLRSLSIRVDPPAAYEIQNDAGTVDRLHSVPQFIESLNISGITGGLCHLIQDHHKLTKITLCETHLKEDDLTILGKLGALNCLRLQHNSYTETDEIVFSRENFRLLSHLHVEGKHITKLRFASGAAPELERIVWSFERMDALSGVEHLRSLRKLELNGDCDLDPIKEEILKHYNDPTLKHKPRHQTLENRTAVPTSSPWFSAVSMIYRRI